jgi:hypothetical protein
MDQRTADTPAGGGRTDTPAGGGQGGAILRMAYISHGNSSPTPGYFTYISITTPVASALNRGNSKEFGLFSYTFLEGALEMGPPPQLSKNSQKVYKGYVF